MPDAGTRVPSPAVVGPQGGAPKLETEWGAKNPRQPWSGTPTKGPSVPLPPSPWSLKEIGAQYKPVVDRIKENLQKAFEALPPDQRVAKFWQGFQQYPEQMATMVARRALTNQAYNQVNQGPISEWLSWLRDVRG